MRKLSVVKCTDNPLCLKSGVIVVVIDESSRNLQFVLSGTTFQYTMYDPHRGTYLLNAIVMYCLFQGYLSFLDGI